MARIFLCHASEDKTEVRNLYHRLAAIEGFEPWLDEEDLLPGQIWETEIPRALKEAEFILIFFSGNSVAKRGYVQREMKMALDAWEEVPTNTIHTIPVRLDECEIPKEFRRYHRADLFDPRGFERLVRALQLGLDQRGAFLLEPLSLPQTFMNCVGMEFILIPAGKFMMGSPDSDPNAFSNEKPAHQVTISQPFYLSKCAVTQAQWQAVMDTNPSNFPGIDRPVECISWRDSQAFLEKLNECEGGRSYRLPTEAEWEYACRAGTNMIYHFGDNEARLGEYAWYIENSDDQTHVVGQKSPNAWGLYDMHGNVLEWVQDRYGEDYYQHGPACDPQGPDTGADRVFRGGGWSYSARLARAAFRSGLRPGARVDAIGFRCASSGRDPDDVDRKT